MKQNSLPRQKLKRDLRNRYTVLVIFKPQNKSPMGKKEQND